ncbi:MAG: hypothetical protein JWN67_852 [Actinomycetia bacterium]|nr:hypothetical protein [Actinomycetes bacterium]
MTTDFASVISTPPSGRGTAVVLDHQQYAQVVILQGQPIPWADPAAYATFDSQARQLLRPDATLLDLGALYDHVLASDEGLKLAMMSRSRRGWALKVLLGNKEAAATAFELASVAAQTSPTPLVLQIPSPMLWLARTHVLTGAGTVADLNADDAENAAMYVADWLGRQAMLPVSMLLLDERWRGRGDLPLVDSSAYTPVANVADHHRWAMARRTHDRVDILGSDVSATVVPPDFWLSDAASAWSGDVLFAEIPAHAVPETVLSQLAKLN